MTAKAGAPSRPKASGAGRGATRQTLVQAAIETLKAEGFTVTSARAIAKRAGCNQALVFYHFGSVVELLLAALDEVSARRLERYSAAVAGVSSPLELVAVATEVFREDLDNGYVTVLAEMIAGTSATPGLGKEVAARIAPWRDFARHAIDAALGESPLGSLVPTDELSYAVVALYLGLEMLSNLDGDRSQAMALFDHVSRLATLLE